VVGQTPHRGSHCDRESDGTVEVAIAVVTMAFKIVGDLSRIEDDPGDFTVVDLGILSSDSRIVDMDVSSSNFRDVY